MPITLSPDLERRVREHLARGPYDNPEAVIREALDHLEGVIPARDIEVAALRRSAEQGAADVEAGRSTKYDREGLRQLFDQLVAEGYRRHEERRRGDAADAPLLAVGEG